MVTPNSKPTCNGAGKVRQLPSPYGTGSADDTNIYIVLDQIPFRWRFKIGDTVTVIVQLANKTGILWLPPAAIRDSRRPDFCDCQRDEWSQTNRY